MWKTRAERPKGSVLHQVYKEIIEPRILRGDADSHVRIQLHYELPEPYGEHFEDLASCPIVSLPEVLGVLEKDGRLNPLGMHVKSAIWRPPTSFGKGSWKGELLLHASRLTDEEQLDFAHERLLR